MVKNPPANAGDIRDVGSIPVSETSPGGKSKVLVAQSCPTLCNPTDCSPPGSSVHGILQVRILEWVAIYFFRGSSLPRDWTQVSCIADRLFTVWATEEDPPWRRAWQPTPVLPGEFHGQRSLAGYSPWGPKKSDTTEWLTLTAENQSEHFPNCCWQWQLSWGKQKKKKKLFQEKWE